MRMEFRSFEGAANHEDRAEKEFKDKLFAFIVNKQVFEEFAGSMAESGFSDGEIAEIKKEFDALPLDAQKKFLALPWELREKRFDALRGKMAKGEIGPKDFVRLLQNDAEKNKFNIGYHLSKRFVEPRISGEKAEWTLEGKELDDRDNMKMAYYSKDYANLYRDKQADNLYVVRIADNYKSDESGWGRAPKLPIISALDMERVDAEVEKLYLNKEQKGKSVN